MFFNDELDQALAHGYFLNVYKFINRAFYRFLARPSMAIWPGCSKANAPCQARLELPKFWLGDAKYPIALSFDGLSYAVCQGSRSIGQVVMANRAGVLYHAPQFWNGAHHARSR
ncbi:MAG: hypothetical protein HY016_03540 [Nitrosomonadales bacterium]|nr:hypothetical protein [Nitrosomonadales bacterium]